MKHFKDPIYGYISIEDDVIDCIIDTAEFQRLRFIIQTSYSPLYSSAVHNRFVHSLGVFYLGKIASKAFYKYAEDFSITNYNKMIKLFEYACLLHDVGHAPFSHTGEDFYLGVNNSRTDLHNMLIELTNDNVLAKEIKSKGYAAAPHELMSAIIAIKQYNNLFDSDEEKSFFARCILGYEYFENVDTDKSFYNCMISMLNSSVIDVDKLDYLIRDAYIIGFDTVSIDYKRLLHSIVIAKENNQCKLIYKKSALSVIENVVFAHDAERKWIQNHPVILYDGYLLKYGLEKLNLMYKNKLFSIDALGTSGIEIGYCYRIALLSDGDIIYLMKNLRNSRLIKEYFSRKDRKHPLWKSESEYKALFNLGFGSKTYEYVENSIIEKLLNTLNYLSCGNEINERTLDLIKKDIDRFRSMLGNEPVEKIDERLKPKKIILEVVECFQQFAAEEGIDFDFTILKANQFNSGFSKLPFENIQIEFSSIGKIANFKKVTNALSANKSEREKFYYVFYRRNSETKKINMLNLASKLGTLAIKKCFQ